MLLALPHEGLLAVQSSHMLLYVAAAWQFLCTPTLVYLALICRQAHAVEHVADCANQGHWWVLHLQGTVVMVQLLWYSI